MRSWEEFIRGLCLLWAVVVVVVILCGRGVGKVVDVSVVDVCGVRDIFGEFI